MQVGAGNAFIKFPTQMFPVEGFCGIHDDPRISVLNIKAGQQVVIISMELVMLWDDFCDRCRSTAAELLGAEPENVWLHVTHAITTPHAPGGPMIGLGGDAVKMTPEQEKKQQEDLSKRGLFEQVIMDSLIEACEEAAAISEAKLFVGSGDIDLIQGRDIKTDEGWWIGIKGDGKSNETMTTLVFKNTEGEILGTLLSYGMKPCVIDNSMMDKCERQISADAPGLAARILEDYTSAPVLYCTAAAGDRIPVKTAWYDEVGVDGKIKTVDLGVEAGLEFVNEIGTRLGEETKAIIDGVVEVVVDEVCHKAASFSWPSKGRIPMHPYKELEFETEGEKNVPVEVIKLGSVALVGGKPEINTATELSLQEKSSAETTLYLSMINGGMKYMPDEKAYDELRWEALASMLMRGAAEKFVELAVGLI